jgi:Putative antitoxin
MHFQLMPYTTLTVRHEVAKRLRATRGKGESYSDVLNRLLDNQPAKTVEEWMDSLAPLQGRALFTPEERTRLIEDQRNPRHSRARRKADASA